MDRNFYHTVVKTLQRRAKDIHLVSFSQITDDDLDSLVRQIVSLFPSSGEVMLNGHLQSLRFMCNVLVLEAVSAEYVDTDLLIPLYVDEYTMFQDLTAYGMLMQIMN